MPSIELSETTYNRLKDLAEPFVDTPETVIRRLMDQKNLDLRDNENSYSNTHTNRGRAARGERTPVEDFIEPLITVLRNAGGELKTQQAVDRVGDLMKDELVEIDFEPLKSNGEARWRNTCRWARKKLVEEEIMDPDSPHGIWRLSRDQM